MIAVTTTRLKCCWLSATCRHRLIE
uniref:Uncharacterized protein n=1 Tax=Arundo donax TaxID=35708 RepID=A0A0A8XVZ6_ARUDO